MIRRVICPCGNDTYRESVEGGRRWVCGNCGASTPRRAFARRKTNKAKALEAFAAIRADWAATDEALTALVDSGAVKGGALLVHASTFDYHLGKLLDLPRPSNWELQYHEAEARRRLAEAQVFVAAQLVEAVTD